MHYNYFNTLYQATTGWQTPYMVVDGTTQYTLHASTIRGILLIYNNMCIRFSFILGSFTRLIMYTEGSHKLSTQLYGSKLHRLVSYAGVARPQEDIQKPRHLRLMPVINPTHGLPCGSRSYPQCLKYDDRVYKPFAEVLKVRDSGLVSVLNHFCIMIREMLEQIRYFIACMLL